MAERCLSPDQKVQPLLLPGPQSFTWMFVGCHCTPITRFSCPGAAEVFPHHSVGCSQGTGSWTCSGFSAQGQVQGEEWVQACCSQQGWEKVLCPSGAAVSWPPCKVATFYQWLQNWSLQSVPAPAGGASLGLTSALPHTPRLQRLRPRISVLYPHPGHGAELCQVSNTATFQFHLHLRHYFKIQV